MKDYILKDEWNIIERGFVPEYNRISESIFSIGNGHMGQRANFEESYSGDSLQGSYLAGVYYPDKTRVGWWKNGYPEYFAKIINSVNWIGIKVVLNGQELDLARCVIHKFERRLDMRNGLLSREVEFTNAAGERYRLAAERFVSIVRPDAGLLRYSITPVSGPAQIEITPYLDGNVTNEDANYDETFWQPVNQQVSNEAAMVCMETRKTGFRVCAAMQCDLLINDAPAGITPEPQASSGYVAKRYSTRLDQDHKLTIYKYAAIEVSLYHTKEHLEEAAQQQAVTLQQNGYEALKAEHSARWQEKWQESDIVIEGDLAAQQAIRFNIFQLYQTYTGDDPRLNIGPKGFTGEKYGGVTYWDTEAYCLPFYLRTAPPEVARNLLRYRYNHLPKAIENARKLGFTNGAALYPMVTINGEECHNEWEITFEEIHRNGAIAYAIYNYIRYTGDTSVIKEFALEVLIAIARFWAQRVNWSEARQAYVILGVTGPNEYENNVNNNWYTNYIARWCLDYTREQIAWLHNEDTKALRKIFSKTNFDAEELNNWQKIASQLYLPVDKEKGIFIQQDGFFDKEIKPVSTLPASERPIVQHWSWDRILRSCYIKQADVLQGLYLFEDHFDTATIERNFAFYEPLTVHESSLSASVHCVLANRIGATDKAYEMYLRTARLDLDDYNEDTRDGLHITSMGGTWMAIVEGFAGLRVQDDQLMLTPNLPASWQSFTFSILFRGSLLHIRIDRQHTRTTNRGNKEVQLLIRNKTITAAAGKEVLVENRQTASLEKSH